MQGSGDVKSRFLCNYPEDQRISSQLLDFFYSELVYARSMPEKHTLWLISPWMGESNFDLSLRVGFEDFFPDNTITSITLSQILKRFLDYETRVNLVCKPPHTLFNIHGFHHYLRLEHKFHNIEESFQILQGIQGAMKSFSAEKQADITKARDETEKLKRIVGSLKIFKELEKRRAIGQGGVINFVQELKQYTPEQVRIYYNTRLHAKMVLGKYGGFIGSANITHSGLNFNDELFAYVTDQYLLQRLHYMASRFARAEGYPWKMVDDRYDIHRALEHEIEADMLDRILKSPLPSEMREILERVNLPLQSIEKGPSRSLVQSNLTGVGGTHEVELPEGGQQGSTPVVKVLPAQPQRNLPITDSYEFWFKLARWAKEQQHLTGEDRRFAYIVGEKIRDRTTFSHEELIRAIAIEKSATELGYPVMTPDQHLQPGASITHTRIIPTHDSMGLVQQPEFWFSLANWGKTTEKLSPWERHFVYNIGVLFRNKKLLSDRQIENALRISKDALENGFQPET